MTDAEKSSDVPAQDTPAGNSSDAPEQRSPKQMSLLEGGDIHGIGRAIILPWSTAVAIAVNSMRQRFWRSMITTALIVMTISFMMYMSSQSAVLYQLKDSFDKHETEFKSTKNPTLDQRKDYEHWKGLGMKLDKKGLGGSNEKERNAQTNWLMFLAALVALVGISNAMLMSVTERFREIGTMKCLGALDSFIVKLFFLESMFQGITGTVLGIIVGLLLMIGYVSASFGSIVWENFPTLSVFGWVIKSFVVGTVISTLAAILPAWRASIMQPVDALRSEV